jgi:hypothetical protein
MVERREYWSKVEVADNQEASGSCFLFFLSFDFSIRKCTIAMWIGAEWLWIGPRELA